MIVQIPAQPLLHCLKFIDKGKRARPNIQAVHIDNSKMIATNGTAMIVYDLLSAPTPGYRPDTADSTFTMYFPPVAINTITPILKKVKQDLVYDTDMGTLEIGNTHIQLDRYDGTYPDYRKVTPTSEKLANTPYVGLDSKLLALFGENLIIHFTDPQSITVVEPYNRADYRWYGLIMPLNTKKREITIKDTLNAVHGETPVNEPVEEA